MPTLDWLNRDAAFRTAAQVPTRVLRPHRVGHVFGAAASAAAGQSGPSGPGNLLIQGDNLDALQALLPFYRGRVKCIFIDPPYNTKSAFEHYDDNLEHSQWLSMMLPRLQLLRELLSEDGSIWVTIDDHEGHYLKVMMDEVFGRGNFVATILWRKNYSPKSTARHFSEDHDYVLVFGKNAGVWTPKLMPRTDRQDKAYKNADSDPRGVWKPSDLSARNFYSLGTYPIVCPGGRTINGPPAGRFWSISEQNLWRLHGEGRIWWGLEGNNVPAVKRFLSDVKDGVVPQTWWSYEEVGHTQDAKKEVVALFGDDVFGTPKPEALIQRIVHIATDPGDLVLDSFLGSGTTAAVAHKMGRRWIGIEMGDHAISHCLPRLRKVIDGEQGGISVAVGWQGGGGFRLLQLGAPLFDASGDIHADVRFADLAAFVWMRETGSALAAAAGPASTPLLGLHEGCGYYLLFNGVLGDRRPASGNVLTSDVLVALRGAGWHDGPKVIYGEACRLGPARLAAERITFKQLPHAVPR